MKIKYDKILDEERESDLQSGSSLLVDTTNFNNILGPTDTTVQAALDTLDNANFNTITLKSTYAPTGSETTATVYRDTQNHCLTAIYEDGHKLQIGQEGSFYAKNTGSTTIKPGDPLSLSSAGGSFTSVEHTDCTNDASVKSFVGLSTADGNIPPNGWLYVTYIGEVRDLNTDSFTEKAILYVNPLGSDVVPRLTMVQPDAPNYTIIVGRVEYKHASNGRVLVRSLLMPKLNDLSDVDGADPTTLGDLLTYDPTLGVRHRGSYNINNYSLTSHKHYQLYQPNGLNPFVYTDNGGNLHVDGNITQTGSTYETHAEQLYTTKNLIYTRDGAIAGLAPGEYTGFQAKKYDGLNDGQLVFDKDGRARVGDVGSLQKLATIEETSIDQGFAYYNNATNQLKTKLISTSDLTDTSDLVKISTGGIFTAGTGTTGYTNSGFNLTYTIPTLTANRTITLQNASGTMAYTNSASFTSLLNIDNSTATHTLQMGYGATISGATKTINIGLNGVAGSTTNINIGSALGSGVITLNEDTTVTGDLTVSGGQLFLNSTSPYIVLGDTTPEASPHLVANSGKFYINFDTPSITGAKFTIDSATGNVGINTSTPKAKLDVSETTTGNLTSAILYRSTAAVNDTQLLKWQSSTLEACAIGSEILSGTDANMVFYTNTIGTTSLVKSMTLTHDGNLQITSGSITATTGIFTNLTDNYIPYHQSDVLGLADSPIYVDTGSVLIHSTVKSSATSMFEVNKGLLDGVMHYKSKTPTAIYTAYRNTGSGFAFNLLQAQFQNDVNTANLISIGVNGANNIGGTPTLSYMYFGDDYLVNAQRIYPNQDVSFWGKVGVGAPAITDRLEVFGNQAIYNTDPVLNIRESTKTTWTSGDLIGEIKFSPTDGSGIGQHSAGGIKMFDDASAAAVTYRSAMSFWTAAYNTEAVEAGRIDSGQRWLLGSTANSDNNKLQVTGNITTDGLKFDNIMSNIDITTASYTGEFLSILAQDTASQGVYISPDGVNAYITGVTAESVYQFRLGTQHKINSGVFVQSKAIGTNSTDPRDLFFSPDGLNMFTVTYTGAIESKVVTYTLSTAWDISTLVYVDTFVIEALELTISAICFSPNGLNMYCIGATMDTVYRYGLTTARRPTTGTLISSFSVNAKETAPSAIRLTDDGSQMFIMGTSGDDINQYDLTIPREPTSAKFMGVFSIATEETTPNGFHMRGNGEAFYIVGSTTDRIHQYSLPSREITVTNSISLSGESKALSAKFGDVAGGNYTEIETGGTLKFNGTATVWMDVDFPIIIRTTGANIPTLTTLNGNITMPQWAVNDYNMCESQEFVHMRKEGSTTYFHIHLTTNGLDATNRYVRFEVEYGYVTPSGQWVFPAVMDSGDLLIPANTPTKTMFIFPVGNFTPTGVKIGGHTVARLKRIASTGTAPTGNPRVPMLQQHIECDTLGSREMTTK